jgi:hypothetical protein
MTAKKKDMVGQQLEQAERDMLMAKYQTALKKGQFINELKGGLGNDLKANPNGFVIHKKPFWERVTKVLKKIFTKF